MGAAERRTKDGAMAARMKQDGVKRTSTRCPVCNAIVSLPTIYNHIATACRGGRREDLEAA